MSLQLIGDEAGVSAEKIEMAVGRITGARWDAMADPTGNAAKQFRQLGISMEELRRMSPEETLQAVARAMAAGAGNGAVMAAAMDMVGSRSKRVLAVLQEVGTQDDWRVNEEVNHIASNVDKAGDKVAFLWKAFKVGSGAVLSDAMDAWGKAVDFKRKVFGTPDEVLQQTADDARSKRMALESQEAAARQIAPSKIDEGLRAANVNATLRAASLSDSLRRIGGGTAGTDSHLQEKQYDAILEIARNTRAAAMKDTTPKFAR
jgi:hypothetical protein